VAFECDPKKAEANFAKRGVRFAECLPVFDDDFAITVPDEESDSGERRFVSVGLGAKGRVLVVVYSWRRAKIRIIICAESRNARTGGVRGEAMKRRYDFSKGKRGRILPAKPEPRGKTRITIRIDEDLVDHFLKEADNSGGAVGYQTLINDALRQYVQGTAPRFEDTLRRIVREELRTAG
jgi:uncharacterized DUF497 family protein/uncharacterized protein (DUF4415 family)